MIRKELKYNGNKVRKGIILSILFFSFMFLFSGNVFAASFAYDDFNWDTFAEENKAYWEGMCENTEENENCKSKILKYQKRFYVKLYKSLAKYQKKGVNIHDDVILETVFFDMSPSTFADSDHNEEYVEEWNSSTGAYVIDDDENDINYNDSWSLDEFRKFYEKETDSLKMLIKNTVSYDNYCYGRYEDPVKHCAEDKSCVETCDNGGSKLEIDGKTMCLDKLEKYSLGFWEYFLTKIKNAIPFLGKIFKSTSEKDCAAKASSYPKKEYYQYTDGPTLNYGKYFDFLINNRYFDGKKHLQTYFKEKILIPAEVDCMTNVVCSNSLESKGGALYDQYEEEAQKARKRIVEFIRGILYDYGLKIAEDGTIIDEYGSGAPGGGGSGTNNYWWPIGSAETTSSNGITFASGDPERTSISSYFGPRIHPITKQQSVHGGIDIPGANGSTNVIASMGGEVYSTTTGCPVGDYNCGGGYGNHIVLSHPNGSFTVYAHLQSLASGISNGVKVAQGQVIGKVGTTGSSTGPHLHFEVQIGGHGASFRQDPLNYVSADNPRPAGAQGDFDMHSTSLSKTEFISKLRSYCNTHSCQNEMLSVFVAQADTLYDASIANNINPEFVVVRAMSEGFSPGGSSHNYWGINCTNTGGGADCRHYGSLAQGIAGLANLSIIKNSQTAVDVMKSYAYIGRYWYNPGSWSTGGCKYLPYISEFMDSATAAHASSACAGGYCDTSGGGSCVPTTDADQTAYATWQVQKMATSRNNVFGL